jgi:hypothetical protein
MQLYLGTVRFQVVDPLAEEKRGGVLTQKKSQYNGKTVIFRSVHLGRRAGESFLLSTSLP